MGVALLLTWSLVLAPAGAEAEILALARAAQGSGDAPEMERWIRLWATLSADPTLPAGLEAPAAAARAWAKDRGGLRLFGERGPARVRAGLVDPSGAVARVDAWIIRGDQRLRLTRGDGDPVDRPSFLLERERSADADVLLEAVVLVPRGELVVRSAVLPAASVAPPPPPDQARLTEKLTRRALPVEVPRPPPEPLPWWWIAGGVVAAGLVGWAVVDELR